MFYIWHLLWDFFSFLWVFTFGWMQLIDEFSWFRWINGAKELNGEQKLMNEWRGSESQKVLLKLHKSEQMWYEELCVGTSLATGSWGSVPRHKYRVKSPLQDQFKVKLRFCNNVFISCFLQTFTLLLFSLNSYGGI